MFWTVTVYVVLPPATGAAGEDFFVRCSSGRPSMAAEQRLFITALDCELTQYDHLPALRAALNPPRQFIAVLCRPS